VTDVLRQQLREEGTLVIARVWRGVVRREDADEYADYIRATGFNEDDRFLIERDEKVAHYEVADEIPG
jgi:hypothetical protein